jgi:hypothetical protein
VKEAVPFQRALISQGSATQNSPSSPADLHVITTIATARQHLSEFAEVKTSSQALNDCFDENQLLEVFAYGLLITCHLKLFAPRLGTNRRPINTDHFEAWFLHAPEDTAWAGQLLSTGVAVEKPPLLKKPSQAGGRKCPPKSRMSFVGHPDAILFWRISWEGVFQQPQAISPTTRITGEIAIFQQLPT